MNCHATWPLSAACDFTNSQAFGIDLYVSTKEMDFIQSSTEWATPKRAWGNRGITANWIWHVTAQITIDWYNFGLQSLSQYSIYSLELTMKYGCLGVNGLFHLRVVWNKSHPPWLRVPMEISHHQLPVIHTVDFYRLQRNESLGL